THTPAAGICLTSDPFLSSLFFKLPALPFYAQENPFRKTRQPMVLRKGFLSFHFQAHGELLAFFAHDSSAGVFKTGFFIEVLCSDVARIDAEHDFVKSFKFFSQKSRQRFK